MVLGGFQTCLSLWGIRAECQHRDHGTELDQNEAQCALVVGTRDMCRFLGEAKALSLLAVIASDIAWETRGVKRQETILLCDREGGLGPLTTNVFCSLFAVDLWTCMHQEQHRYNKQV